jgi:hypothetical protein
MKGIPILDEAKYGNYVRLKRKDQARTALNVGLSLKEKRKSVIIRARGAIVPMKREA